MTVCMADHLADGIVPHDVGTLGHAAERVLHNELPHRDFDDPYTGLLSVLNGSVFRIWGVSLATLRLPLLVLAAAGYTALFCLLRAALPLAASALITTAAFWWSLPNYFSGMPSWYNLFFSLLGAAALMRYPSSRSRLALATAGLLCGVSVLVKVIGLYSAASAAMFVIFVEQRRSEANAAARSASSPRLAWVIIAGLCAFVFAVGFVVSAEPHLAELVTFWLPPTALAGYLAWNEHRLRYLDAGGRLRRVLGAGGLFAAGFAIPVCVFLAPYVATGSLDAWFEGVFISPLRRLSDTQLHRALDVRAFLLGAVALGGTAWSLIAAAKRDRTKVASAVLGVAFVPIVVCGFATTVYSATWAAMRLLPLAAVAGLLICLSKSSHRKGKRPATTTPNRAIEPAFLLVSLASVFSLVQIPQSHGIYFLYAAAPAIAAWAAVLAVVEPRTQRPQLLLGGCAIAFALLWIARGNPIRYGEEFAVFHRSAELETRRGVIHYDEASAHDLRALLHEIEAHSSANDPILALPDLPEAYFLTDRRNPTRTFFDVFDADYASPERDQRLLKLIDDEGVRLVVFRNIVSVSPQGLSDRLRRELRRRFPHESRVWSSGFPIFTVRWRDEVETAGARPAQSQATEIAATGERRP
jgi:hypothetical protein